MPPFFILSKMSKTVSTESAFSQFGGNNNGPFQLTPMKQKPPVFTFGNNN